MIRSLAILHDTPKPDERRTETEDCNSCPDVHESRVLLHRRRRRDYVRADGWRNIAITLSASVSGEEKAQSCEKA